MLVDGVLHRVFDDFRRRAAHKRAEAAVNLDFLGFHLLQERHRVGQVIYYRGIRLHLLPSRGCLNDHRRCLSSS